MKNIILIISLLLLNQPISFGEPGITDMGEIVITDTKLPAGAEKVAAEGATEGASKAAGESGGVFDKAGDLFSSSAGVAILAGISAVLSGILYKAAKKQEEDSEENIKKIDKIIAEFNDAFIFYCPKGREDLTDANCYCYTEDGKKNPNRTKSQTCMALWSKDGFKLSGSAGSYAGGNGKAEPVGCMTQSGQFDEKCGCRKFIDAKGNNACYKASSVTLPSNEIGSSVLAKSGLQDAMKLANNSANGNPNFGGANSSQLVAKAIDNKNIHDNLLAKVMASGNGKGLVKVDEGNVFALTKKAIGEKGLKHAIENYKMNPHSLGTGPTDNSMKVQVSEAAKKVGVKSEISGGSGLQNRGDTKKDASINVNVDGGSGVTQIQNLGDTTEQKTYKIKNDVNKDKSASLFQIISNRYINSGLRRLFEGQ
jgi:hypothetical protein